MTVTEQPRCPMARRVQSLSPTRTCTRLVGRWLCLLALLAMDVTAADREPARPNILFIMVDTLRADHVGCYGYARPTTPAIDALAAEGVRFAETVAASSWTMPSLATMFTGVPPAVHRVTGSKSLMSDRMTTLAAELRKAGYQTAGVTSNPMGSHTFGYATGFDFYDDFTVALSADLDLFGDAGAERGVNQIMTSDAVNRVALSWLTHKRVLDKPFFLFLLYFDPHADYVAPREYAARFTDSGYRGSQTGRNMQSLRGKPLPAEDILYLQGLYDAEIRYTDDRIGRLLQELRNKGLYDNTLTVVISDHGEEFWEHGSCGHGATLYEECVMVPWVMRLPGTLPAGKTFDGQVSHQDVMPTLLGLAGCTVPTQCNGRDLSRALVSGAVAATRVESPAFMDVQTGPTRTVGARTHAQKVLRYDSGAKVEVFSLADDRRERQNLAGSEKARAFDGLFGDLNRWEQTLLAPADGSGKPLEAKLDAALIRQLRSIGYVH